MGKSYRFWLKVREYNLKIRAVTISLVIRKMKIKIPDRNNFLPLTLAKIF